MEGHKNGRVPYNSTSSSTSSTQHQEQKKKRNRRKPRFKNKDTTDNATQIEKINFKKNKKLQLHTGKFENDLHLFTFTFTIKSVDNPKTGQFIKERNSCSNKRINLNSFVTNSHQSVFVTNLLNNLTISANETLQMVIKHDAALTKIASRKFPIATLLSNINSAVTLPSTSTRTPEKQKIPRQNSETPVSNKKKERKEREKTPKKINNEQFENYLTREEAKLGISSGLLIKGFVRINPKNFKNAYVSNENTSLQDYYINSVVDRNRALDGDEVVLRVKPQEDWVDGMKTAVVVFIEKMIHPRITVGTLKTTEKKNVETAHLYPRDKRVPILQIFSSSWPNGFKDRPSLYENTLFVARITEWKSPTNALGVLTENLGMSGDLKVESIAILREFCLDTTPFKPDVVQFLPKTKEIPQEELDRREDIRGECIFTIDPLTARDLDDAVSVKELPNGNYEIGVHISDAAHFLQEGTELDQIVSKKATTIYLVDNVYHMLPVELCLHCSLLPGADKLAFSVFWEMNEAGEIFSTRFVKTVLNSCCQLAYEHAQLMIEDPTREFTPEELPKICNDFTAKDLSKTVNILQRIAVNLRQSRVDNGALKIDQVKLYFTLSPENGEPVDFKVYENKEAHRLIEEFMLLANISVAQKTNDVYPELAFLRCHEPPKNTMLVDLQKSLESYGIHIDVSSSGGINSSMMKYITDDFLGQCRGAVLNHLTAKTMTRARYFCASTVDEEIEYKHYALSVPIYTHFTSPIRRYADIMVHRLLAASLGYTDKPSWDFDYVSSIAANCNGQKYNAKRAGEASSDLYLAKFIEENQPFLQDAVVVDVKDRSFDVIVLKTGSIVRLQQNSMERGSKWKVEAIKINKDNRQDVDKSKENEKKLLKVIIDFPKTKNLPEATLVIEMFALVKVNLTRKENTYKLEATMLRPVPNTILKK